MRIGEFEVENCTEYCWYRKINNKNREMEKTSLI
jgi:hypothetical protein